MLRAGMAAPTAVNKQPWHFVVINDKAKLNELAAANPRAKMLLTAPLAIPQNNPNQRISGSQKIYPITNTGRKDSLIQ